MYIDTEGYHMRVGVGRISVTYDIGRAKGGGRVGGDVARETLGFTSCFTLTTTAKQCG